MAAAVAAAVAGAAAAAAAGDSSSDDIEEDGEWDEDEMKSGKVKKMKSGWLQQCAATAA